ncbi:Mitochondrial GTPase 1 [Microbotryomycetes sp. JL221]|nr:Mitochondrial GTPase 1 [Microbotryomycetes sp. JL221]
MTSTIRPFVFPSLPATWYIGHMSRAMREMQQLVKSQQVDLIIETRDARLPLTSINPAFERMVNFAGQPQRSLVDIGGTKSNLPTFQPFAKRLIVYNKADLAQTTFEKPVTTALRNQGHDHVLFTDSRTDAQVKALLKQAIDIADRPLEGSQDRISVLIAGMPNVGKSSILNALRRVGVRKGKAASTSSMPGHTRRLSTVIKVSERPPVYVYDTPGIMVPFLGRGTAGSEAALKLALTGGIKESLFETETLSEYLLWRLRTRCELQDEGYDRGILLDSLNLPQSTSLEDPKDFFMALAHRLAAMRKGGEPDIDFAGRWLIQSFRDGKLGRWTLDGLGRGGEAVDVAKEYQAAQEQAREPVLAKAGVSRKIAASSEVMQVDQAQQFEACRDTDTVVEQAVGSYLAMRANDSHDEMTSGHQAKKQAKAEQARVRNAKKRAHAVVSVRSPGGPISSARRRKYRR